MSPRTALVLVPTYNEKDNIIFFIESVRNSMPDADILIIDDNSPDGTGKIANKNFHDDIKVHVMHRKRKEGLGVAYISGFKWALEKSYSHIFQIDADFSHDPNDLSRLLEATDHADIALGSRWIKGGSTTGWTIQRRILSRLGNIYARTILGVSPHDLTGGFKCFRRNALESIDLENVISTGYGFQIEITWLALKAGLTIREVPINFKDRTEGVSKLSGTTFKEALTLVWKLRNIF